MVATISPDQFKRVSDQLNDLCDLYGVQVPRQTVATTIIRKVWQAIRNYCNIDSVPEDLESVWGDMAMDYLRYALATQRQVNGNADTASGTGATPTYISSITEMSVSVGFQADSRSEQAQAAAAHDLSKGLDGILMNYIDQLNRFRRMTW